MPLGKWTVYQERRSTQEEIRSWYGPRSGFGLVCGKVSENLEALEFDDAETYHAFHREAAAAGLRGLVERIETGYLSATPGNGYHWLYRSDEVAGNTKLARRPKRPEEQKDPDDKIKVLIETRGEGGYIVEAPSNGRVHPTGHPYRLLSGGVESIVTLTPSERTELHRLARTFDQLPEREFRPRDQQREQVRVGDLKPGEDFNDRADWALDVLEPAGWTYVCSRGEVDHWRRPGKRAGISATTNYAGSDLFYVFSSSTPFQPEQGYSKFRAFAILHQDGNFQAAAKALADRGFGSPPVGVQLGIRRAQQTLAYRTSAGSESGAVQHGATDPPAVPPEPAQASTEEPPQIFPLTDLGNSERYVARVGNELLYCKLWGDWLYQDGRRWKVDGIGQPITLAKLVVRTIYAEAADAETKEQRKALSTWAIKSEAEARINAMVSLARSALPAEPGQFDTDPWLLNVRNGTLDLRSGTLREHRSSDYITKLISIEYDPSAECPRWLAFLERVLPDPEVRKFIQRAAGYSATGSARERCVLIPHGSGKNGKGVLLQTLRLVLGEYAVRTPSETFLAKRSDAIPNDVAQLRGARFVFASETNEGRRLAEATIKDLTGGEDISARFMRGEWFSFAPTFTPWLATNHRPVIRGSDPAIWDRVRLIPFSVRIPDEEQDPELTEKLRAEYPGILTWIVRGAVDWYANGLGTPEAVRSATKSYQSEMDLMGAFIDDRCIVDPQAWALASELYKAYVEWSSGGGERPLTATAFGLRLVERGFTRTRLGQRQARTWSGLRLLGPDEGPQTGLGSQTGSDAVSRMSASISELRVDDLENESEPVFSGNRSEDDDDDYAMAGPRSGRSSHCWHCKESWVATSTNQQCDSCGWLICDCGACGKGCEASQLLHGGDDDDDPEVRRTKAFLRSKGLDPEGGDTPAPEIRDPKSGRRAVSPYELEGDPSLLMAEQQPASVAKPCLSCGQPCRPPRYVYCSDACQGEGPQL
jgi:putative DNA primase/helicase